MTPAPPSARGIGAGRLAGLSMSAAIWTLSWPILTQSLLDSCVGLVDTTLAARLGVEVTDAVGSAAYIMWLIGVIIMAVGVGATAMISRAIGGGDTRLADRSLGQCMALALIVGAFGGSLLVILAPWVGAVFNLTDEATRYMRDYLWALGVSLPSTVITFIGIACMRGAGDSIRPLWVMVVVNLINMPVSWLLCGASVTLHFGAESINAQGPEWMSMGVAGIGLGTGVARTVGAILIIRALRDGASGIRLTLGDMSPHWETMQRVIRISVPNLYETLGMWIGNLVVLLIVGWIVTTAMGESGLIGVHMITIRIEAFSFLPGLAMGSAAATLVGQYLGAGDPASARRAALTCATVAGIIMIGFGYAFVRYPIQIVSWVSEQPLHLELAPRLLWIIGWVQAPFGVMLVLRNSLRGAGDTKMTMYITWISVYGVRVPACALAAMLYPERGLEAIWIVMGGELLIRTVLIVGRFLHGGWMRIEV
ncbi:MAG: MATE family efflux transporter [Phycisphaerales bacterium]